jgi:hypothetical protein
MSKRDLSLEEKHKFWMSIRQAFLMVVDAIERRPDIMHKPRTAELRTFWKSWKEGNK